MASLHRQNGRPYWYFAYTDQSGKRHFKSSKTSDKKEARRVADACQRAVDLTKVGTLTEDRARKVIENAVSEILETSGIAMQRFSVEDYLNSWLKEKEVETELSTSSLYARMVKQFIAFLGLKAKQNLTTLRSDDVQAFRDHLLSTKRSATTVNMHLSILRIALDKAIKRNLIDRNAAKHVETVSRADRLRRRAFTLDELRKIIEVANDDWRTMIYVGLYTGLRLGDIATLTWTNVDLLRKEITVHTRKTRRTVILPIAKPLLGRLELIPVGDDPKAALFSAACSVPTHYLSNQFRSIMASAGLVPAQKDTLGKKTRHQSDITFHSLRHTATSLLKNAGVSDVVARDLIGHDSAAVSASYTHIDTDTKRAAVDLMPDVLAEG